MIATLITSPLGVAIGVLLLLVLTVVSLVAYIRQLVRLGVGDQRARQVRHPVDRIARRVFHEARQVGQDDCSICRGDGGTLELLAIPWGLAVELEAHGMALPVGLVLPVLVRCPSCGAPLDEDRHGPGLTVFGQGSSRPALSLVPDQDDRA